MLKNWFNIAIVSSVIIGVAYAALRLVGSLPAEGGEVAYPFLLAYYYGALPISILLLVVVFSVGFWWVPLALVRRPGWKTQGALIALTVLAFGLSVWSAAPLARLIYRDVAEVQVLGVTVRLGVRAAEPGAPDTGYVVMVCPGMSCRVTYLADPTGRFDPLATIRVDGDAAVVAINGRELTRISP